MNQRYIPNRYGALLKFRADATPEEIAKALNSIKDILDLPDYGLETVKNSDGTQSMKKVPFKWSQLVSKYDDRHGEPCFYIP